MWLIVAYYYRVSSGRTIWNIDVMTCNLFIPILLNIFYNDGGVVMYAVNIIASDIGSMSCWYRL
jgi:hypothetical protein